MTQTWPISSCKNFFHLWINLQAQGRFGSEGFARAKVQFQRWRSTQYQEGKTKTGKTTKTRIGFRIGSLYLMICSYLFLCPAICVLQHLLFEQLTISDFPQGLIKPLHLVLHQSCRGRRWCWITNTRMMGMHSSPFICTNTAYPISRNINDNDSNNYHGGITTLT